MQDVINERKRDGQPTPQSPPDTSRAPLMPWGRFDDEYAHNRKIRKLSHEAFRLDVAGILWCCKYLTDGFIADDDLPLLCAEVRHPERAAEELANRRRWEKVRGGWYIHDFLDYNPSAEQVATARETKTDRQRRWRQNRTASRGAPRDAPGDGDVDARVDASTDTTHDASRDGTGDVSRDGAEAAAPRARVPSSSPSPGSSSSSSPTDLIRAACVVEEDEEDQFLAWIRKTRNPGSGAWWRTVADNGDFAALADQWRALRPKPRDEPERPEGTAPSGAFLAARRSLHGAQDWPPPDDAEWAPEPQDKPDEEWEPA